MIKTISLTSEDTLPGVLAKLRTAQAEHVLLVVPEELRLTAVDLRVLRREAAATRIGVALVTSDAALRSQADRAGISTFRSVARGEQARWRRLRPDAGVRVQGVGPAETAAPLPMSIFGPQSPSGFHPVAFLRAYVRRPNPVWALMGLTVALLALLGGMLYALSTIIPSATITLTPAAEPIRVTAPLKAVQDARLDVDAGVVPAQIVSVQVSGDGRTATTGQRQDAAGKAKGQVVFINRTTRQVTVSAGTVVYTGTGNTVRFATGAAVTLPPNGRAAAPVEALEPGPAGNARAGTVTRVEGPLALSVMVANEASFTGGTTAKVNIVTEEDKTRLQEQLFAELKRQALTRLNGKVAGQDIVPAESVSFVPLAPTFTPFVGEAAPELYLSMSVQAVGLAIDSRSANQLALARLQQAMPPGSRLISDTLRFETGAVSLTDAQTVAFQLTGEGTLLRSIDEDAVRQTARGRSPEEAAAALQKQFALARAPTIHLGPDWLPYVVPIKLPALPWRIRVRVDWDAAAQVAMGQ